MAGTVVRDEDTVPEAAPPGPRLVVPGCRTAELSDDPEQAEQATARTPMAATSVPFLTMIAPVYPWRIKRTAGREVATPPDCQNERSLERPVAELPDLLKLPDCTLPADPESGRS